MYRDESCGVQAWMRDGLIKQGGAPWRCGGGRRERRRRRSSRTKRRWWQQQQQDPDRSSPALACCSSRDYCRSAAVGGYAMCRRSTKQQQVQGAKAPPLVLL